MAALNMDVEHRIRDFATRRHEELATHRGTSSGVQSPGSCDRHFGA